MNTLKKRSLKSLQEEAAALERRKAELTRRIRQLEEKKEELALLEERKRVLKLERRKKEFAKLSPELQRAFKRVGWDPIENNESRIIRRQTGTMHIR